MPWHKVCHQWSIPGPHPTVIRFCTRAPTYPGWYQRIHLHDPDPAPFELTGVEATLLRDGDALAAIQGIASSLSPEIAKTITAAVHAGVEQMQKQLPKGFTFGITSERHD